MWSTTNLFQLNPIKCKEMIISFTQPPSIYEPVCMGNQLLERVKSIKSLGVTLRNDLKWNDHVNIITSKASKRPYLLKQLKRADVAKVELVKFYCSCIRSVLEYACQLFHSALPQYLVKDIERIQKRALRIIYPELTYSVALGNSGISTLKNRREYLSSKLFNEIASNNNHISLQNFYHQKQSVETYEIKEPLKSPWQIRCAMRTLLSRTMQRNTVFKHVFLQLYL